MLDLKKPENEEKLNLPNYSLYEILQMLSCADFEIWYKGKFEDWISEEQKQPTDDEIVEKLERLLK